MKTVTVLAAKRLGITCCERDQSLQQVAQRMAEEDVSSLVVVDASGYLAGIISRTDIVRAALAHPDEWRQHTCRQWMTSQVITVEPEMVLEDVARLLQRNNIHRVVVVHTEGERLRPIAVVSDSDIVYHLARRSA